jgi:Uma2 family endonuclease
VLSPTTRRIDQVDKRDAFLALDSMQTYWIVDPDTKIVETWDRSPDGWTSSSHTAAAEITAACLGATLRVVDIVGP